MIIRLSIPFPPSINRLWRVGRGGRMYRSKVYEDWREEAGWSIKAQSKGQAVTGGYKLSVLAKRPDKRRRDLDNVSSKAVNDLLQHVGIVTDDCLCHWVEARWVKEGDPFVVTIEAMDE